MWQRRFVPITKNNINNKDYVYKCAAISSQNNVFLLYKVHINIFFVAFYFETRKILQRPQCRYDEYKWNIQKFENVMFI